MTFRVLREAAGAFSTAALAVVLSLAAWTVLPTAAGWKPSVVLSGSMVPAIQPGDVVVSGPISVTDIVPGRVLVLAEHGPPQRLVIHRAVALDGDGTVTTRGDHNQSADSEPRPLSSVVGLPRLRIPAVGLPVLWMHEGRWSLLATTLLALTALAWAALDLVMPPAARGHGRHGTPGATLEQRPLVGDLTHAG